MIEKPAASQIPQQQSKVLKENFSIYIIYQYIKFNYIFKLL